MNLIKRHFGCIVALSLLTTLAGSAGAQQYKTAADTLRLNKEYQGLTADVAELNTKLTTAKDKRSTYQDKTNQANQNAQSAAQQSKAQADVAAGGNIKDINKELKKAKKASSQANDAKDAANDQKANEKEISYLNTQIQKKQNKLSDLDKQRAAILAKSTPVVKN